MTDRELLEKAAKAAGVVISQWTGYGPYVGGLEGCGWNPLTDDGDALRLMVELRLMMDEDFIVEMRALYDYPGDKGAATRRAIVRAAAEMATPSTEVLRATGRGQMGKT